MSSDQIDPEDRVKLDTWYQLTNLLDEYHLLAFDPMYQRSPGLFASARDKEVRENKLKAVLIGRERLVSRWEKALGPKWRDALIQQD
jgi:hypothetical protein